MSRLRDFHIKDNEAIGDDIKVLRFRRPAPPGRHLRRQHVCRWPRPRPRQPLMPWVEVLSLLAMLAGCALWFDSFQSREAGMRAVRAACAAEDLLLLDDTVALASLRPGRDDEGRLRLRRVYRFEFSDTGNNRRDGQVTLLGSELVALHLPHSERSRLRLVGTADDEQNRPFPRLPS